jgi:mono/diheme cytochrome c family protein
MVLKSTFLLGLVLFIFSCQSTAESKEELAKQTPAEQGASLYTMHCAQCHGEDGKLGSSGAKDLSKSVLADQQVLQIIKNGKGAMPSMKALLETEDNIHLVLSHVKALRR